MKLLLCAVLLTLGWPASSQTTPVKPAKPPKPELVDFAPDLAKVTADLKQKFESAPNTGTNFDDNLAAINALIVKHLKDGNREQVARLYLLDAHIYADGLTNTARAKAIWAKVATDFPGTVAAQGAAISLTKLNQVDATVDLTIPEGLEVGQRFPNFSEKDLYGKPLSVAAYRGKVTLVDFWATWCGPCKAEMPNVIATYQKYHKSGFDIIGVSLDQEQKSVLAYTQAAGMTWAQYFDGAGWGNKIAKQYGVQSIPMAYLLDKHGVIIAKEVRGRELGVAVEQALNK
jgi:thiol-disulfide isomerase/thioredoxin